MGKYISGIEALIEEVERKYYFTVIVRIHGKNQHSEQYSIKMTDYEYAKKQGYFDDINTYLDWKPLKEKKFDGGIFKVREFTTDDKYIYAYVGNETLPSFSLPKYLEKQIRNKQEILVGYREK